MESQRKSHHQIQRIREPYCGSFKLLSTKMWNFTFFARRQITDACLFVFLLFIFSPGVIVSTIFPWKDSYVGLSFHGGIYQGGKISMKDFLAFFKKKEQWEK